MANSDSSRWEASSDGTTWSAWTTSDSSEIHVRPKYYVDYSTPTASDGFNYEGQFCTCISSADTGGADPTGAAGTYCKNAGVDGAPSTKKVWPEGCNAYLTPRIYNSNSPSFFYDDPFASDDGTAFGNSGLAGKCHQCNPPTRETSGFIYKRVDTWLNGNP
jgi:hypothetical protein